MAASADPRMVRAGSSIRFDVGGSADGYDPDSVKSAIVAELHRYLDVQYAEISAGGSFAEYFGWPFRLDVVAQLRSDYGSADDVSSIVRHAVYEATGYLPSVSIPGLGQPDQVTPTPGALPSLPNPFKEIFGEVNFILVLVLILGVVLVMNVGGKTTRVGLAIP